MDVGERISKAIHNMINSDEIKLLEKLDPETKSLKVSLNFYVIEVKDGNVFIETGTKDKPSGIASSNASDVLIYNKKDKAFLALTVVDLKEALKKYKPPRKMSEDYRAMGFLLTEEEAWKYFNDASFLSTLPF